MKIHINCILLIMFMQICLSNAYSADYWSVINSPTTKSLSNCFFINSSTGWASGDSGIIIKTSNGGNSWVIQESGTYNNITDIFFLNANTGWALAWEVFPDSTTYAGTIILKTTNSGNNWIKSMYPDTNYYMKSVFFRDSLNGYMGGTPAIISYTTNGGNSWIRADIDTTLFVLLPIFKIAFYNESVGYACGGFRDIAGITWVTTNSGRNWKGTLIAPEPFFDIAVLSQRKAICSGGDLEYGSSIAMTSNQGVNWFYDTLGVFGLATGISFRTPSEGWMTAGYSQKFIYTLDTGHTWISVSTPENKQVFDVVFTDTSTGYAVGTEGAILKYINTSSYVNQNNSVIFPEKIILFQNFPNPFNPVTKIKFDIVQEINGETQDVKLIVYDALGREVTTLLNEKLSPGSYEVEFDAGSARQGSNLSSGIYYYKLNIRNGNQSGEYSQTKRMVLLK